jgi:3',5'-cyclic AMP phosphodiesterase CpdA
LYLTKRFGAALSLFCLWVFVLSLTASASPGEAPVDSLFDEPATATWADESRLIVALMGDPQLIMTPETPEHVSVAMADLAMLEHDFIAVLGDLVQGRAAYYEDYVRDVVRKSTRPVFSLAGNGDLGAGLDAYLKATGLPLNYRVYRRGIRFIFLSTVSMTGKSKHICGIGAEQLEWLENELAADTESTTVLFSHPPVFETTWHSEDRSAQPFPGSMYLEESAEMRKLFSRHPNIKVFAHGHLHHSYAAKDEYDRGAYHKEGNVLHISVGATANGQGGSFLFIDDEKITVRVRDNARHVWRDDFTHVYTVKTTFKR